MEIKAVSILAILMLFVMVLAGCGESGASPKDTASPSKSAELSSKGAESTPAGTPKLDETPVHLKAICVGACISDDDFKNIIADPLNKQYPFLTIELMKDTLDKALAGGEVPDIVFSGILDVTELIDKDMQTDLQPYIKKYNLDLNSFEPSAIEMVKKYGKQGEIYSIPYKSGAFALYYNKDIFDHFGVNYPKDGMTWQEVIDLAGKLTRTDGGIAYRGLATMPIARLSLTMLQDKYDSKTGKAVLTTDSWAKTMQIVKAIYSIPGNEAIIPAIDFTDKHNVAMWAGSGQIATWEQLQKAGTPFNWDMVSFPTMPENKGKVDTPVSIISISSQSKHKDQAFQVIKIATSKEAQMKFSGEAGLTVLKDQEIKDAYGKDYQTLKGKNIKAPYLNQSMPVNVASPYDDLINKEINTAAGEIIKGNKDINTALRNAEENANAAIALQKK